MARETKAAFEQRIAERHKSIEGLSNVNACRVLMDREGLTLKQAWTWVKANQSNND